MKKYILGLFALLLLVGFSAFKIVTKTNAKKTVTTWYFQGNSAQVKTASQWTTSGPAADCSDNGTLPCSLEVDANNQMQLQTYLNSQTASQIINDADGRRP